MRRRRSTLPPLVCRWDLDKTYLRSDFATVRQLVRTAFERGADKVEVPGVVEVVKGLRAAAERHERPIRTYFLSASPPQIGKAIRDKLALDGVPYDGITFKDQLQNVRAGRLRYLREHVGYKLLELLRGRLGGPRGARELLFGDDWESDALVYSLYADVVAGRLLPPALPPLLARIGVDPVIVPEILTHAGLVTPGDAVARIFINLERRTPPAVFGMLGPRVVPTFNYVQTAAVLAVDGYLDPIDVVAVARALLARPGYGARRLANSLSDLVRRAIVPAHALRPVERALRAVAVLEPPRPRGQWRGAIRRVVRGWRGRSAPATRAGEVIDYQAIIARLRPEREPTEGRDA